MSGGARRSSSWIFSMLLLVAAIAIAISAATISNGSKQRLGKRMSDILRYTYLVEACRLF